MSSWKNSIVFVLAIIFCLVLNNLAFCEGGRSEIIIVTGDKANPPRLMGDGTQIDWQKPGVSLELLKKVGEELGIKFTFKRYPWKRALYLIESNQADGIFHTSFKKDRLDFGVFPMADGQLDSSRKLTTISYVLYKLKSSAVQWDGKQFINVDGPIGATSGYAIVADLQKMGVVVDESTSQIQNLNKLQRGRLAAYAELENMADLVIENNLHFDDIEKVHPPLKTADYFLMFSKDFYKMNGPLAEQIWDKIKNLNSSGHQAKFEEKYIH